MSKANKLPR